MVIQKLMKQPHHIVLCQGCRSIFMTLNFFLSRYSSQMQTGVNHSMKHLNSKMKCFQVQKAKINSANCTTTVLHICRARCWYYRSLSVYYCTFLCTTAKVFGTGSRWPYRSDTTQHHKKRKLPIIQDKLKMTASYTVHNMNNFSGLKINPQGEQLFGK